MSPSIAYLLLIVVTLVLGLGAQGYVNSRIRKYSSVPAESGLTGAQAAEKMLAHHGVSGVAVKPGRKGQDFFDPRSNSITLDPDAFYGTSITAQATACHEVGHACQYAQGYAPMKFRTALVPVVQFASNAWMWVLIVGVFLNVMGLIDLAIIFYAFAVLFQVVTLPVEFDASHRAMQYMGSVGVSQGEQTGAWDVLRACALTYVAAALASALQLIYLLSMRDN